MTGNVTLCQRGDPGWLSSFGLSGLLQGYSDLTLVGHGNKPLNVHKLCSKFYKKELFLTIWSNKTVVQLIKHHHIVNQKYKEFYGFVDFRGLLNTVDYLKA